MIGPVGMAIVALACLLAGAVVGGAVTFCLLTDETWPRGRS